LAVRYDVFNPAGHGKLTQKGWEFERSCVVDGIVASGAGAVIAAVNQANLHIGDQHPQIPTAKLEEITPEHVAPGVVTLRLTFREHYKTKLIEVGTTLQTQTVNKDKDGNLLSVRYQDPTNENADEDGFVTQNASTSFPQPHTTFSITRQEDGSPGDKSRQYVGKVNEAGWAIDPDAADRTWMLTGIVGRSHDGGNTYEVTYTGEYKDETWDVTVTYVDPATGRLPGDVTEDDTDAIATYEIADTADFNELALDE